MRHCSFRVGMMREGSAKQAFTERGIIMVGKKDKSGNLIDKDRAEDIAIEVGAEEVEDVEPEASDSNDGQEEDGPNWTFYTMARDVTAVKLKLESLGDVEVISAETKFLPLVKVPLSKEDVQMAVTLIEKMQELEEVSSCYDNIKAPDA